MLIQWRLSFSEYADAIRFSNPYIKDPSPNKAHALISIKTDLLCFLLYLGFTSNVEASHIMGSDCL